MLKNIAVVIASLAVSFGASAGEQLATAEQATAPAKLVIYRAEESSKTRKIKFHAKVDGRKLGRMKYSEPLVAEVTAGDVLLGTSLPGSKALEIRLQPGQTYYVHSKVKRIGQTVTPELVVVEEQLALTQLPAVDGTI
jgi:hypothetical protein